MSALPFSFLASACTASASLAFRANNGQPATRGRPNGYLLFFYFFSFLFSLALYPDLWKGEVSWVILSIGACVGFLNTFLMGLTSRALERGPAGLTFAFQNASAIFPGLILFLLLGSNFGFSCSLFQIAGMALALFGLFVGARNSSSSDSSASFDWLKYALACFFVQILALTFIQARCVLFDCQGLNISEADDIWFMPGFFGVALISRILPFLKEKRWPYPRETLYGIAGGVANFGSTYCLLLATKFALPFEKGILFPCFAVITMILCDIWASRLYQEKFSFKKNFLCAIGIFMAVAG